MKTAKEFPKTFGKILDHDSFFQNLETFPICSKNNSIHSQELKRINLFLQLTLNAFIK